MARYGVTAKPERAPAAAPPPETVVILRRDVRMAAIGQFVAMFKKHVNLQFEIEDLEYDLAGERPNSVVPTLLGRLCNTLANDRNTNSNNWLPALRRAYAKRLPNQDDNPFYRYERVPMAQSNAATSGADGPPASTAPIELVADGAVKMGQVDDHSMVVDGGDHAAETATTTEVARAAEPTSVDDPAKKTSTAAATNESSDAGTAPLAPVTTSVASSEGAPTASTSVLPSSSSAVATRPAHATDAANLDPSSSTPNESIEQRLEVAWEHVDLDTRVQAIYNVCEWHMDEPDRFRRNLKPSVDDDDLAWRVDPIGRDAKGNRYYALEGGRLWVQRVPPKKRKEKGVVLIEEDVEQERQVVESKRKGKGKMQEQTPPLTTSALTSRGTNGRKHSRSVSASEVVEETPGKRTRRNRVRGADEVWQEIPEELLKEWGVKDEDRVMKKEEEERGKREGSDTSSALTSLADEDEEKQTKPKAERKEKEKEKEKEKKKEKEIKVGETKWEDDYWAERDRIESLEGFVEWEAICVTLDEWNAFAEKLAHSTNAHELALHESLNTVVLPSVRGALLAAEKARQQEYFAMMRKRSTRIASKESEEEERQRLAALKAAEDAKSSRASRHKVVTQEEPVSSGPNASISTPAVAPPQETREERLRKREEEKKARELAHEQAQIEAAKMAERQAAIEANGGVLPSGMETDEEIEARRLEKERIARLGEERAAAEAERIVKAEQAAKEAQAKAERDAEIRAVKELEKQVKKKQQKKAAQDRQKAAKQADQAAAAAASLLLSAAAQPVAAPAVVEEPWYFECEDDGYQVMCCEQCETWHHVDCHVQRDALMNRPAQQYSDERFAFYCSKCRDNPKRKPPKPPARLPPVQPFVPGAADAAAAAAAAAAASPAPAPIPTPGKQHAPPKSTASRPTPARAKPSQPSPTARPVATHSKSNGHASATATTTPRQLSGQASASPSAAATGSQPAASLPAPGQPSLSYPALKALIESNPVLINQLPPQYQSHFSQLLGIPVPYPTSSSSAVTGRSQPTSPKFAPGAAGTRQAATTEVAGAGADVTVPQPHQQQQEVNGAHEQVTGA